MEEKTFFTYGDVMGNTQKTICRVMLVAGSGETSALKTYQKEYLNRVVAAVNEAFIAGNS